ncbi:helix-turn-helix domain protein [Pseudomonas aeruginosa]|nr:Cro/Cl family transcriptional regulator [Pseudomonas aeruginosa LES431]AHK84698.1 Cro/Cl family transcriptional regulator [Pseudomonas aeruginosa LESlike5]AHK90599.1 Cro/Cl family transcriptional regulator [Pseudomonas aeruginosa LESlike7]AHK96577.1 Cro/Cl family transcriptional regulator [Pseudomonas aeruginosa LES400]AHL02542.1 Cro/Cl family transcriptional regulator [Pseudomonas aeruginosa LESB65]AHL08463.1 Cro/Cl family transcriptional regulator [Pseudomonas aeruginosa LESlike1]AHL1441
MSNILPNPTERPSVLEHVSGNVRRLRLQAGLSQEALARAASVSRRMLVGIESGDVNVSLSTLDRIAAALGVLFPDLVQAPATDRSRINAVAWVGHHPESRATLLASAPARREVELWAWSLGPGERYVSEPDAAGWREMVLVIEGRLRLELADGERRIEAGDFHAFASDQPYAYVNDGDEVVRFTRNVVS